MTASDTMPSAAIPIGEQIGVVLMAYGTPRTPDEIPAYYTDIRRGNPPSPEQLADLTRRYEAIGGVSPLAQRTEAQRDAIQRELDGLEPGRYRVTLGLKHADPKIESAVEDLIQQGFGGLVGLVLAPHFSAFSVGQYLGRARAAADEHEMSVAGVDSWATEPAFVEFVADDLARRLVQMPSRTLVVFTAHSLPERILASGDPYVTELQATAQAVADRLGLAADGWQIGWQSAGRTPEPWLGPDILRVIDDLAADDQVDGVVVSAVGFVADHLEVLYDLDLEASQRAAAVGLAFDRTACVNDDPGVMAALARRVHELT